MSTVVDDDLGGGLACSRSLRQPRRYLPVAKASRSELSLKLWTDRKLKLIKRNSSFVLLNRLSSKGCILRDVRFIVEIVIHGADLRNTADLKNAIQKAKHALISLEHVFRSKSKCA